MGHFCPIVKFLFHFVQLSRKTLSLKHFLSQLLILKCFAHLVRINLFFPSFLHVSEVLMNLAQFVYYFTAYGRRMAIFGICATSETTG